MKNIKNQFERIQFPFRRKNIFKFELRVKCIHTSNTISNFNYNAFTEALSSAIVSRKNGRMLLVLCR